MVKLRLARAGGKKQPVYRIVATDSRSPRDGRFIEAIGQYNPNTAPKVLTFKDERLDYWLGQGAQPSETLGKLILKYRREQPVSV
ncbi:MAG: 30S ribosomal protein S16 [Deltaproteobacteria bacterium]|nr:30S ribosomal protein S16 [Deltaproteobacteria bacterium]